MAKRQRMRFLLTVGIGLLGLGLFPSVNNFTPAYGNESIDSASSVHVVVNKSRPLHPMNYKPSNLVVPGFGPLNSNPYQHSMRKDAALAAEKMAKAMNSVGKGRLVIQSAYRSFATQKALYERYVAKLGVKEANAYSARPGYSEHQTGLAIDVSARNQGCQIRTCFGQTKAGAWLSANSYKYGFILRYPSGATSITGYQYEPWHFRFVGVEVATDMKVKGIKTLEEYFNLPAAPKYQ